MFDTLQLSPPQSKLGDALHFFVEDTAKIFVLLLVMIYVIAMIRASLDVERVRDYLADKPRFFRLWFRGGYLWFNYSILLLFQYPCFSRFYLCRNSPLGITMAFLITSPPLINEVAVLLLVSLLGWKFTLMYILVGLTIGIVSGFFS